MGNKGQLMTDKQLQQQWLRTNKPTIIKSQPPVYKPVKTVPIPTNVVSGTTPRSQHLVFDYDETKRDYGK